MIRRNDNELWSPPIWVDFMSRDGEWRVPLDYPGTLEDLVRQNVTLVAGMYLTLYSLDATDRADPDDLIALASVEFDRSNDKWFARIDPESFVHQSDLDDVDRRLYESGRPPT